MNKLIQNASKLSTLFMSRAQLRADIQSSEDKIAARELTITPVDGWIGKNEGERTTAKMRAFAADPGHCQLTAIMRGEQVDLGKVLAEIEGLQADTSAVEFTIRDETNRVMGGKSILDVLQDCEIEEDQFAEVFNEEEVKAIEAQYEKDMLEAAEEQREREIIETAKLQPPLDFEPGSADDPSSPNYIPF